MKPIIAGLEQGKQGPEVANLQDALAALLECAAILPNDPILRQERLAFLQNARARSFYGDITSELVSTFQKEHSLDPHGRVDEPTAATLNELLDGPAASLAHIVSGTVRREDGLPLANVPVRAYHEAVAAAIRLGEDITDIEYDYRLRLPKEGKYKELL